MRDAIYHEERLLKSVLLFPLVVFAPWAAASTILTERALPPVAAQIGAVVLAALLAAFYHYLFVQEDARREDPEARPRFRDTYFERGFWIFAILGAALGSMAVQLGWIAPAA